MTNLTPYDTGEVSQPIVWVNPANRTPDGTIIRGEDRSNWGKVDYEDDAGETFLTAWVTPSRDKQVDAVMHIDLHTALSLALELREFSLALQEGGRILMRVPGEEQIDVSGVFTWVERLVTVVQEAGVPGWEDLLASLKKTGFPVS